MGNLMSELNGHAKRRRGDNQLCNCSRLGTSAFSHYKEMLHQEREAKTKNRAATKSFSRELTHPSHAYPRPSSTLVPPFNTREQVHDPRPAQVAIGRHCPEAEEFGSEIKPQFMQSLGRQQDVRTPQVVDEKAQAIEILDESDASGIRDTGMETANEVIVVLDGEAEQPMELYCSNCEEATGFKILKQLGYTCRHSRTGGSSPRHVCVLCVREHVTSALGKRPLLPEEAGRTIICPAKGCSAPLPDSEICRIAPDEFNSWAARASEALITALDCIRCPNPDCGAAIERLPATDIPLGLGLTGCPEIDRTAPKQEIGANGRLLSREAMRHKWQHRYRCAFCSTDFCDACSTTPYHDGFTCEEFAAPRCSLCRETPLLGQDTTADTVRSLTAQELRAAILAAGSPDISWCIERGDFEAVYHRALSVCSLETCRGHLARACSRTLPCGHPCAGIREEANCVGCLQCTEDEPTAKSSAASQGPFTAGSVVFYTKGGKREMAIVTKVDNSLVPPAYTIQLESGVERDTEEDRLEPCPEDGPGLETQAIPGEQPCVMCHEPLLRAPVIRLEKCGHLYHLHCCQERLKAGCPGPNLSFGYLSCPVCRHQSSSEAGNCQVSTKPVHLDHPALQEQLRTHLELQAQVVSQAKARVRAMGPRKIPELQPGGKWDGRPVDYALEHFLFYQCYQCKKPYFGGARECGAAMEQQAEGWNPEELLCPRCSSSDTGLCPEHGMDYMEWKCRFCCSVATWSCFGGTHMCNTCHDKYLKQGGWGNSWHPPHCSGPQTCPLKVKHPANGMEFCLGCALCRGIH